MPPLLLSLSLLIPPSLLPPFSLLLSSPSVDDRFPNKTMGISSMPTAAEAFLPVVLVANALSPFTMLRDGLQRMLGLENDDDGDVNSSYYYTEEHHQPESTKDEQNEDQRNGVRLRRFRSMGSDGAGRCCCCCVCLHRFEGEDEVGQVMSCRHFFHRGCLDGWLDRLHTTCPLCRSTVE